MTAPLPPYPGRAPQGECITCGESTPCHNPAGAWQCGPCQVRIILAKPIVAGPLPTKARKS